MNDKEIVDLYWQRDESAIARTSEQYGSYLAAIARNILALEEDVQEVVSDSYLRAWMSMPDQRPDRLSSFLGKITRCLAIDRYRYNHSQKRFSPEGTCSLDELGECISGRNGLEEMIDQAHLVECLNHFLEKLPKDQRNVFLCRYFYMDSLEDIAGYTGFSVGKIKSMLHRSRKKLAAYLEEEGIYL